MMRRLRVLAVVRNLALSLLLAVPAAHALQPEESLPAAAAEPQPVATGSAAPDGASLPQQYGPVQSGESLSTIGMQMADTSGIHVAQVMWALYDRNRSAFDGSINTLRVGSTFSVPTAEQMTAVSIRQARIFIRDAAAGDTADRAAAVTPSPTPLVTPTPVVVTTPVPTVAAAPAPTAVATARVEPALVATEAPSEGALPGVTQAPPAPVTTPVTSLTPPTDATTDAATDAAATQPSSPRTGATWSRPLVWLALLLLGLALAVILLRIRDLTRKQSSLRSQEQRAVEKSAQERRAELARLARGDYGDEPTQVLPAVAPPTPSAAPPSAPRDAEQPAAGADQPVPRDDDLSLDSFDDGLTAGGDLNSMLDLAGGYLSMGQIENARSLLNQVLERGDAEQVAEARRMLATLD